ncbi:MAG: hypothetical protein QOF14_1883 [Hyphomicrobiales bacterium]|jgi:uncharacterized membrane protein|nr:hypothetical protein [Hyphomicrobiales bacterium]
MDFIAAVVAIVALVFVLKMRKRVTDLELRMQFTGISPATPQTAPTPPVAAQPWAPTTPTAPPAPQPSERMDEAAIDSVIKDASKPVPPPPPAEEPGELSKSFEERFGASWVVWIGGLALALGGIFLVQFSIEAGLIGPGVRIFLGGLFAAALVAAGEWMRRKEIGGTPIYAENAHIPSILTAAGTTVAYATIYAAYALYGFLVPGTAFVLLGIVALATLAAALLHGPALAALGQIGAFVVPALVASDTPNYWALYIYLAFVSAGSFALARVRLWRWLVITAVAFGTLWMFVGLEDTRVDSLTPHALHVVASFVLAALMIVSGLFYGPEAEEGRIDPISSGAIIASLLTATVLTLAYDHAGIALGFFTLVILATVAVAWRTEAAVAAVPVAGAFAALVIGDMAVGIQWTSLTASGGPAIAPDPSRLSYGTQLVLGFGFSALFAGAGFLAQGRSTRPQPPIVWAATAVIVPLLILIALYYRIYGFERALPFAALAVLLAALFAVATEMLTRREPRPGSASAAAIFATGSIAALALALTFALEKGWLTVALALMVPGTAWVAEQRPLPWLRWLCGILVALVIVRIGYEPRIVGGEIGTTPIFNWILYGYGIPAIAFWVAGWLLRKRADDVPSRMVDAGAILFTVLTGFLEIRHTIYSGDIYYASGGLAEVALEVCGGLAMAIGLERLRGRTNSIVHDVAALILAALMLAVIGFGLLLFQNPLLTGAPVGGPFFNLLLLGYALPAALAAALGLMTRETRPQGYRTVAAVTAVVLALTYLSLMVTRAFHGPDLTEGPFTNAEGYTYSAVWLAFGVVLLLIGLFLRSQPVRLCSAAVVLLTIGKVFLLDLAGLTGVWRALSLICLGLVLVGIGRLYQKLLFARRPEPRTAPAS